MSDKIVTVTIKGDDQLTPAMRDGADGLEALQKAADEAAKAQRELEQESNKQRQQQEKSTAAVRYTRGELEQAGASTLKFEGSVTKLSDKLQREVRELGILTKELNQLQQAENASASAVARKELAVDKMTAELQQAIQKERELATVTKDTATATQDSASKLDGLVDGINKLSGAMAAVQTGKQILDFTKEGAAALGISKSFDGLSASVGKTSDTFLNELRTASNGYIKDTQLMQTANKAVLLGGQDMATALPTLLKIAGASARATGEDFQFIFDSLVTGISRGSVEILDNAGLTINLAKVQDDYAKSLGKTTDQLTDVEKKQALLNEVIGKGEGFVEKIGPSSDAAGGALQRLETRFQNLGDKIKALSAIGLENFLTGGQFERDQTQKILATGQTYEKYMQGVDAANKAAKPGLVENMALTGQFGEAVRQLTMTYGGLGQQVTALTPQQWELSQTFQANGMSTLQADAAARQLASGSSELSGVLNQLVAEGDLTKQTMEVMEERITGLAVAHPELIDQISNLITQFQDGTISSDEFRIKLDELTNSNMTAAPATQEQALAMGFLKSETDAVTASVFLLDSATYENTERQFAAAVAAQEQAMWQRDLQYALDLAAESSDGQSAAVAYLVNAYGIEESKVISLINLYGRLNQLKGGKVARDMADVPRAEQKVYVPPPKKVSGGSGRSKGAGSNGKSEAVREAEREAKELEKVQDRLNKEFDKANKQREKMDQSHVAEVKKIWDRWRAEELAATEKFNTDKFQDRVANAKSLVDVDQDLWDEAQKMQVEFWDKSQKIAQEGDAQKADEFLKAANEYTAMKTQHAQELRDLDAKIAAEEDAAEKQKLQQKQQRLKDIYAEEEKLAGENLDKILLGQEEIDKARDDALAKENADYTKAQQDLATSFAENVQEVVKSSDKVKDSISGLADHLISEFARISAAAAMPVAGPAAEPAVDGSHALGLKRVPFDNYIARLHKDERILTRDEAKAHDQMVAGNQQSKRVPLTPSRSSMPVGSSVNMSMPLIFNGNKPAAAPALTTMQRELEAAVKPIVDRYIEQDRKRKIMRG
ncbi:phage tail tape measure protein [Herpetosiphon geysericola]|uniref:Phage tail tape measure protein domain-containing protein n=1 Tax=Herpetosiphon geysericola TaxID=70996 RepID=A0A0P6XJK6_9CHLR|nr:hypothetical protein [Herpetosiphon geysericola]KPL80236.1 hypothetical protein SE18_24590 [Herpetosiphon geysericola]